ncbi:alpha/beta hydrolase [Cladophialophora carrionii]|uniref:Alpha/beta hydrolase n=1 Tax=Cladophialophora carrionii TaxID=86049 RepID=A0A1C1CM90_9EURO|nr:alpha/beta hydrolase [Cladophialophora carrionii]
MATSFALDADFEACLKANGLEEFVGGPPFPSGDVDQRRKRLKNLSARRPPPTIDTSGVDVSDHYTVSEDGHRVLLRWYCPRSAAVNGSHTATLTTTTTTTTVTTKPAVIYIHGGGLICSTIDDYNVLVTSLVSMTRTPFLAVEYRLAPEHRYPAALHDVYAALAWLHARAHDLHVDQTRIAIMGSSAGAGLGAATAILARRRGGGLSIAKQIFTAPMIDCRNVRPHDPRLAPLLSWNHLDNATGWSSYLGDEVLDGHEEGDGIPDTASPSRLVSAEGMPPLYLEVGSLDIFVQEGIEYASKHVRAGVPVELHVYPGLPHSYDSLGGQCQLARMAKAHRVRAITCLRGE